MATERSPAGGIPNSIALFPGAHISKVAFRRQGAVLPFFGRKLAFPDGR